MNLKLSKTAIRELTKRYRAILMATAVVSAFMTVGANAAETWQEVIAGTKGFMDGLTSSGWDRNNGSVTGYGVDQILGYMEGAATKTDATVALVKDSIKGNEALYANKQAKITDSSTIAVDEDKLEVKESSIGSAQLTDLINNNLLNSATGSNGISITAGTDSGPAKIGIASNADITVSSVTAESGFKIDDNNSFTSGALKLAGKTVETIDTAGLVKSATGQATALATTGSVVNTIKNQAEDAKYTNLNTSGSNISTTTLNGAILNLDSAIGDMSGFASNNYAKTTSNVADNLKALDTVLKNTNTIIGASMKVDGTADTSKLTLKTQSGSAVTNLTDAVNLIGNLSSTGINADTLAGQIGSVGTTVADRTTGKLSGTATVADNLKALDTAIGADVSNTKGNLKGVASVNENLDALDKSIGKRSNLGSSNASINTAVATDVATGLKVVGDVIGNQTFTNSVSADYGVIAQDTNLTTAISQVASNIGTADQLATTFNDVAVTKSVNSNINALNTVIGDVSTLNHMDDSQSKGNAMTNGTGTAPATVVQALNNIDATLGTIHGLNAKRGADAKGNLATGTTVEQHLVALDDAIGDRSQFSNSNYMKSADSVANAMMSLDHNVHRIEKEMKGGFASVAAMSALQPNARAAGDTQISMGAGAYRDHQGFAIGAFHYFNDNVMANLGASYAGDKSTMFRAGVTFGW